MKNINVNLNLEVNVNVDGERVGGMSTRSAGLPLGLALAMAGMAGGCAGNSENDAAPVSDARDDEVTAESVSDASGAPDLTDASEGEVAAATEAAAPTDDAPQAAQDHSKAEGSSGTNPAKLAWALDNRFVVGSSDEELYAAEDVEDEDDTVYRVVDQFDASATKFGNLYREGGGFAKLGSRRFHSRSSAAASGRGNNFISVVGLVPR